jgi:hypothetical protein
MIYLKKFESHQLETVEELTREQYQDEWVKHRYVGIPDESAKWAMCHSIRRFLERIEPNKEKTSIRLSTSYIEGTRHEKRCLQFWESVSVSKSRSFDFAYTMFEGDDRYYIIRIILGRKSYNFKVDDIIGIENLYEWVEKNTDLI